MRWLRGAIGCVLIGGWISMLVFGVGCADLRRQTVRLHVVAHDDSEAEQALKLQVRDTVCQTAATVLDGCTDQAEALSRLTAALPAIEAAAQRRVYDEGYAHPVTAQLTSMPFATRTYDSGTLPAGTYDALRICIGDADGRNWWCVVYPPLCASAAMSIDDAPLSDAAATVVRTPRFAVRFKLAEWWQRLRRR